MDSLRDRIATMISDWLETSYSPSLADAILELPEIKEALTYRNVVLASHLPDIEPDRMAAIFQDLHNRVAE